MKKDERKQDGAGQGADARAAKAAELASSMFFQEIGMAIELNMGSPGQRLSSSYTITAAPPGGRRFVTLDGKQISGELESVQEHVICFEYADEPGGPVRVSIFENGRAAALRNDPPAVMTISWGEDDQGRPVETTNLQIRTDSGSEITYLPHPDATRTITELPEGMLCFGLRAGGVEQAVTIAPDGFGKSVQLRFSERQTLRFGQEQVAACAIRIDLNDREQVSQLLVQEESDAGSNWSPVHNQSFSAAMQQAAKQTLSQLRQYHGYPEPFIEDGISESGTASTEGKDCLPVEADDPWVHALESLTGQGQDQTQAEQEKFTREQALACLDDNGQHQVRQALSRLEAVGLEGCADLLISQFKRINPYDALYNLSSCSRVLPPLAEAGLPSDCLNAIGPEPLHALRAELSSLPDQAFAGLCEGIRRLDLAKHAAEAGRLKGQLRQIHFARRLCDLAMGSSTRLPGAEDIAGNLRSLLADDSTQLTPASGLGT